ncbi:Ku protein [Caldimonas thermodepolymerans]|jgi:Ku protein, prokaryotic|uniref:Non-homologous end joining protein Ku n=1 Tax=Caldimonas thermodepolymerans TaxID=215580 RepID=A0AA46DHV4_9BURK|nr:Ku protein [Caldimonas thermodepolymerans]TCP09840.1 DNA end-binding protein Ku [Caldimonas thermodepolymerans]UZG49847.1 Ku protein [Caldimonas thermodepolymerans]
MPRVVWKGAITFGLVHIPVTLRAAQRRNDLDFDWLDRRDMAPVGYRRINKRTGKPIDSEHIVKGYQYEKGEYVLMSDEDFRRANPEATQTVDILGFVDAGEISPAYFETPYYLEAGKRGEKGYALLREVLRRSGRAGIAKVVIHGKQHLAALLVDGNVLMLDIMRFADEVLEPTDIYVPDEDLKAVGVGARELEMAERLVDEMSQPWEPAQYRDTYREDLLTQIEARIDAGETHTLTPAGDEPAPSGQGAQVIDLMAALRQSVQRAEGGQKKSAGGRGGKVKPMHGSGDKPDAPPPAPAKRGAKNAGATAQRTSRSSGTARKAVAKTSTRRGTAGKTAARKRA